MLASRLIAVLTLNDGVLFRTRNFVPDYRYTLNFVDAWSVDEIVLLDITRPGEGKRGNFLSVVSEFAEKCYVPLTAGGGIRTLEDVRILLSAGADKVSVNTQICSDPGFVTKIAESYGAQCVVASIDARKTAGGYEAYVENGARATGLSPVEIAGIAERHGAGEILLTSIDHDGSLEGYDCQLCREVADKTTIPILVCGGAGNWGHFLDGFNSGHASAVCTTNIYHFTESSIKSAKKYLQKKGVEIRE